MNFADFAGACTRRRTHQAGYREQHPLRQSIAGRALPRSPLLERSRRQRGTTYHIAHTPGQVFLARLFSKSNQPSPLDPLAAGAFALAARDLEQMDERRTSNESLRFLKCPAPLGCSSCARRLSTRRVPSSFGLQLSVRPGPRGRSCALPRASV